MFSYYHKKDIDQVVRELKWDFTSETILNANESSFLSESNALLMNTLEDTNNPIRAIFAVAKLNEGWDVLNLFDIVRISEESVSTKKSTDSEAQLIGRGARYYPFVKDNKKSYIRRFDSTNNDLKVIETLHYHTINDNAYIKNLEESLAAANIQVKEDKFDRLEAKVKSKIRKLDFLKTEKSILINSFQRLPMIINLFETTMSLRIMTFSLKLLLNSAMVLSIRLHQELNSMKNN
jgi:type III restriction enzyme